MKMRVYPAILTIFLTSMGLFSASSTFGSESCQSLFTKSRFTQETPYGKMKSDFKHDPSYKVEIPFVSDIKNQCNLGTCHLHSWVSMLEQEAGKINNQNIKISTHYLSARHWMQRSLDSLESGQIEVNINLGANVFVSRKAIMNYGIIPDEAWTGVRDFQIAPLSNRINEYVKNIIGRTRWQIDREINVAKKQELLESGKNQIRGVFKNLLGEIPKTFTFQEKEFDSDTFMDTYFSEISKPLISMAVNVNRKDKTTVEVSASYTLINTNIDQIEKATRALLDKGHSVYVSYDHNAQFVEASKGIMSIAAFSFPHEAAPLSRQQRDYFKLNGGGHAVQIVGYDFDPKTGKVLKWKVKNSWGEKSGDNGYYHMYNDYFRSYIKRISFFRDAKIELPAAETQDPVQLKLPF